MPRRNLAELGRLIEELPVPAPEREPGDDEPKLTKYDLEFGITELHGTGFRASDGGRVGMLIARFGRDGGEPFFMANSGDHPDFIRAVATYLKKGSDQ